MNPLLEKLLSIPKSFWVSIHYYPLMQALKLPIRVRYNTMLLSLKGKIIENNKQNGGGGNISLYFGFGTVGIFDKKYERSIWEVNGTIELCGKASFGNGSRLSVGKDAKVSIGANFTNSAALTLVSQKSITIGNNVGVSWNALIMDTDWHPVINLKTNEIYPISKNIVIGNNVWLGTRSVILKGCVIPDGCIVGANSLCSKVYTSENSVIAGNPAEVKKNNVTRYRK